MLPGDDRVRTDDLRLAKPALSQLSYVPDPSGGVPRRSRPVAAPLGLVGFEPTTSPLSGARSNQLSYKPARIIGFKAPERRPAPGAKRRRSRLDLSAFLYYQKPVASPIGPPERRKKSHRRRGGSGLLRGWSSAAIPSAALSASQFRVSPRVPRLLSRRGSPRHAKASRHPILASSRVGSTHLSARIRKILSSSEALPRTGVERYDASRPEATKRRLR